MWLEPPGDFRFDAGQFLHLTRKSDGLTRPYSIASLPGKGLIELHVAAVERGAMSRWLPRAAGAPVGIRGPFGECTYPSDDPQRPLLLAGTGTGLAPLLGVLRRALFQGHEGPIRLYHGARSDLGLYARELLDALALEHPNLAVSYFTPGAEPAEDLPPSVVARGRVEATVLRDTAELHDAHFFLCGNPAFVKSLRKNLYLGGVSLDAIHCDAFVSSPTATRHTGS